MDTYGKEAILDLHNCDSDKFNRTEILIYFQQLCEIIEMEDCDYHFWDDLETPEEEKETEPHLVGTSAIQFIKTSNITIHTLDLLKRVYVNVFSCKDFDPEVVKIFSANFFCGEVINFQIIDRI